MRAKPILPALALGMAAFLGACDHLLRPQPAPSAPIDSLPDPGPGPAPALLHTGTDLEAYPGEEVSESVYVAGAEPGQWALTLVAAPPGTDLDGGRIIYRIPEGLDGPQAVRVRAERKSVSVESSWTLLAHPLPDRPPVLEPIERPDWIVAGVPFLRTLRARDPEGDSVRFSAELPEGGSLRGDELEWTPAPGQAGEQAFRIRAADARGHAATAEFSLTVIGFDPWPFTPDQRRGRTWRIRGYTVVERAAGAPAYDSVHLDRTVTLVSFLRENGSITLRMKDTLSGDREGVRDTTFMIFFHEGEDFRTDGLSGLIPFAWPANPTEAADEEVSIGDKAFPGRREIREDPCPQGGETGPSGCGRSERIFAKGWGLVLARSVSRSGDGAAETREEYETWDVGEP